jgi:hypothetical protein
MDWIEKLFGFNPDGGDGSAELLIVLACCVAVAGVMIWRVPALREGARRLFKRRAAGS